MENIITKFPEMKREDTLDGLRVEYVKLYEQYKKLKVSYEKNPKSEFLVGLWHDLVDKLQVNILKRGYIEQLIKEGML